MADHDIEIVYPKGHDNPIGEYDENRRAFERAQLGAGSAGAVDADAGDPLDKTIETEPLSAEQIEGAVLESTIEPVRDTSFRATSDHGYARHARHNGGAVGQVRSAHGLLSAAGLDWRAEKHPLFLRDGTQITDRVAVLRSDNRRILGTVGEGYGLVQNESLADLADAILGVTEGWTLGQAAAFHGGERVWLQIKAPARDVGGLAVQDIVTLSNAHDGTEAMIGGFARTWAVCANTLAKALAQAAAGLRIRHTSNAEQRVKTAIALAEAAREVNVALDNDILAMMGRRGISMRHMEGLAIRLVGEGPRLEKVRESLVRAYVQAPGSDQGSVFGMLQAVTYHTTHDLRVRKSEDATEAEVRTESAWWGRGADMQAAAWGILADEEATAALQHVRIVRK